MKKIFLITVVVWLVSISVFAQISKVIVHDPVAIQENDKYYVFNTDPGIGCWVSDDLKDWTKLAPVFPDTHIWAKDKVPNFNGHIWAPDIIFHNNQYYLYYSISSFGSNLSCIGVVTNKTLDHSSPDFKWIDHGIVIQSIPGRDNWNAIDPNIIFDENNVPWMSFGSFWGGLKIVKLDNDLISIAEPQTWRGIASRKRDLTLDETDPGNTAVEGPFIFKKNEYYYLFVSFDLCCRGENSTYNVRVGRSKNVTGPYVDKEGTSMNQGGGSLVIEGDEKYYAIGHNSVYTFNDTDYMFSHGYDSEDEGLPKLLVHELRWDKDGWPIVINE